LSSRVSRYPDPGKVQPHESTQGSIRKERQLEGIAKAKEAGVYRGRKATIDADEVKRLLTSGLGVSEVAKQLKISRMTAYRLAA